jgi:RNA polymerase sigma-70 factor (ECF subfamily)
LQPAAAAGGATDDADVIARVNRGEQDQFAILVARYGAVAKRTALLCGAGDDADDVVQEAFVAAYRALRRFRSGEPFRPWLLRIVINQSHNATRSRRRAQTLVERASAWPVDTVLHDAPAVTALSTERRKLLVAALGEMRQADREILAMRYLLDLSEAETATALNLARGTVKSRTARALDRLRTELAGRDLEVGIGDE